MRRMSVEEIGLVDHYEEAFEIKKGHDSGAYYWIQPVSVNEKTGDEDQKVDEYEEAEISIKNVFFEYFLLNIMKKYYDSNLIYNQQRSIDSVIESNEVFEYCIVHNFYTYTCMKKMLKEYEDLIDLLETDDTELIKELYKKNFEGYYKATVGQNYTDDVYSKDCKMVRDFLKHFILHIHTMMKNNPQTNLISVMGP